VGLLRIPTLKHKRTCTSPTQDNITIEQPFETIVSENVASTGPITPCGATLVPPPSGLYPSQFGRLSLGPPTVGFTGVTGGGRNICRRRSFSVTQHGLVNDGDEMITVPTSPRPSIVPDSAFTFDGSCLQLNVVCPPLSGPAHRSRSDSIFTRTGGVMTCRSSICGADGELGEGTDIPVHRVLMLGGPGVGKTALTQQFVTSEYMAAQNTSFGKI